MKRAGDFSQIILYAKGWFEKTDLIEDLNVLVAEAYLLPRDNDKQEIRDAILNVCQEFDLITPGHEFNTFMADISPENYYRYTKDWTISQMRQPHPEYDFDLAVINACLGKLSRLKCKDGDVRKVLLKKPDFNLLRRARENGIDIDNMEWDDGE